tara:strand:+ start:127 stop:318 length:192 start_codon:yes stop_codon:yes gene_type:complete
VAQGLNIKPRRVLVGQVAVAVLTQVVTMEMVVLELLTKVTLVEMELQPRQMDFQAVAVAVLQL